MLPLIIYFAYLIYLTGGDELENPEDSCTDRDYELQPFHVINVCHTFNKFRCLCELHTQCEYDTKTETCSKYTGPICSEYNDKGPLCKLKSCNYDCGNGMCTKDDIGRNCRAVDECQEHCHDICKCNAMKCKYSWTNKCQKPTPEVCPGHFEEVHCRRRNAYYHRNGVLCKNMQEMWNCEIDKNIIAINFGETKVINSHGIEYDTDKNAQKIFYEDNFQIRTLHKNLHLEGLNHDQKKLFETVLVANISQRGSGRCISYHLPLCENGLYELVIDTIELFDLEAGKKTFNILLGDQYIFAELDVMKLAGQINVPIKLVMNFEIRNNVLSIAGKSPIVILEQSVPLSFCYGECPSLEAYFEIGAFSVNKLMDPENKSKKECSLFHGDYWNCVSAMCTYVEKSKQCLPASKGCDTVCEKSCGPSELEMLFLVDSTGSGSVDYSRPFDYFPSFINIVDTFKDDFEKVKFGVALSSDFWCYDFGSCNGDNHKDRHGCYRLHVNLTEKRSVVKSLSQRQHLTILYSGDGDPTLFDAILAVEDVQQGWTRGNPSNVFKIVVIIADAGVYNDLNFPNKSPAKFDGSDSCDTHPPTPDEMQKYFLQEGIHIFALLNHEGVHGYIGVMSEMPLVAFDIRLYDKGTEKINIEQIHQFIKKHSKAKKVHSNCLKKGKNKLF